VAIQETLLVLHDTTEFTYQSTGGSIGLISNLPRKRSVYGLLIAPAFHWDWRP